MATGVDSGARAEQQTSSAGASAGQRRGKKPKAGECKCGCKGELKPRVLRCEAAAVKPQLAMALDDEKIPQAATRAEFDDHVLSLIHI